MNRLSIAAHIAAVLATWGVYLIESRLGIAGAARHFGAVAAGVVVSCAALWVESKTTAR